MLSSAFQMRTPTRSTFAFENARRTALASYGADSPSVSSTTSFFRVPGGK
jgi:hypothetical protein